MSCSRIVRRLRFRERFAMISNITALIVALAGLVTAVTGMLGMLATWRKNSRTERVDAATRAAELTHQQAVPPSIADIRRKPGA